MKKVMRDIDASNLYWLHRQGWELSCDPATNMRRLSHVDGRQTAPYYLVRDAITEVKRIDPSVLSRERKRAVLDTLG